MIFLFSKEKIEKGVKKMKICVKCGYQGEFNFCPECGEKYEMTEASRLDAIEKEIFELKKAMMAKIFRAAKKELHEKPAAIKHRKKRTRKEWKAIFKIAAGLVKEGTSVSLALGKAIGSNKRRGGAELRSLERYLKKHKVEYKKWSKTKKVGGNIPHPSSLVEHTVSYADNQKRKRGQFIFSRANNLMKTYHYSREKAFEMAAAEWREHKTAVKITPSFKGLPIISAPVILNQPELNKILMDMLRNVAKNDGELHYRVDGVALGINRVAEWDDLIAKVLQNSLGISRYLGVENRFKAIIIDDRITVSYKK